MDTIPVEILIHILSFRIPSRRQRKVRRLLSRVCHLWHTAIYSSPFFWTEVRLHESTEELQEILHRNPDGPLDVIWTPSNPAKAVDNAGMLRTEMVSPHSQRWRSLILAGYMTSEMQALLLGVPTPQLVNLNLVVTMDDEQKLTLAREGAELCELILRSRDLKMDWESSRLSGLRCLRLDQPGTGPTVEQLHAILSSSPGLEILDLAEFHSETQFKELGPVLLRSLTTLAANFITSDLLRMLLSCVQAPNCRYIRLPSISHILFDDNRLLENLAKLCQVPLSTAPRLFVCFDKANGSFSITHDTEHTLNRDIRESSVKLAKRRGIFLGTKGMLYDSAVQNDTLQSTEAGVRRFIKEFVRPALLNVSVKITLDLHNWSPQPEIVPPSRNSLVTDLLLNTPLVTDLQIHSQFDTMNVIPFLSKCQPTQIVDGEAAHESSWPIPLMESMTVACDPRNQEAVLEAFNTLISQRGSRMQHGVETAYGRTDEQEIGASPSPRYLKYIAVQDGEELPSRVWDSKQGWRAMSDD